MPTDALLVTIAVVVIFVTFAGALAWARPANQRRSARFGRQALTVLRSQSRFTALAAEASTASSWPFGSASTQWCAR
ncbi:hypothetical protein ACVI8K_008394 [Bradyrhizobium barranii subsp. barranii]